MAANDLSEAGASETRGAARRLLLAVAYLAYVYVASYFLIMSPTEPAFDKEDNTWTYYSACRFGPSARIPGDLTIFGPTLCWANQVFAPIDWLRHQVWPSADSENLQFQATADVVASFAFLVLVFAPVWAPLMVLTESGLWNRCRPLLALPAAGLYADCVFFRVTGQLFESPDTNWHLARIILAITGAATLVSLAFSARGWRRLINVPLWLTLLAFLTKVACSVWECL